jgi:hypothetical protein
MHANLPRQIESTIWGKSRPTVSAVLAVQSELELVLAGIDGFAAGVVEVVPESLDLDAPFVDDESDDDESDDDESDDEEVPDDESVEDAAVDDDFDFPPRLSVL